ncbi:hypothetical protein EV356DRAFT_104105 [Viridothelium virens]|uniref:Uncharacterized protein n=1 Tax=Viridothelium virens TaxID=1048519 RepID=A0A6A6HPT9_VIRVR|nr:hypothetical protein EV356DRAFT_104105 [Viridothelium virens]
MMLRSAVAKLLLRFRLRLPQCMSGAGEMPTTGARNRVVMSVGLVTGTHSSRRHVSPCTTCTSASPTRQRITRQPGLNGYRVLGRALILQEEVLTGCAQSETQTSCYVLGRFRPGDATVIPHVLPSVVKLEKFWFYARRCFRQSTLLRESHRRGSTHPCGSNGQLDDGMQSTQSTQ